MSDLINEYRQKNDPQFQNTLEIPQIVSPQLKDETTPVPAPQPVQLPGFQPVKLIEPPDELQQNEDVNDLINQRLNVQYPTLTYGSSYDDDRRSNDFNEWLNSEIEQQRVNSINNTSSVQLPAPQGTQDGFKPNSLRAPFGESDVMNDGVIGNEFNLSKGKFGQMGESWLGGIFYGLNVINPVEYFKTGIMDATSTAALTGVSLFDAAGALFRGRNPIDAFSNRFTNLYNKVFPGGDMYTGQLWKGRDFGALGAYMTGDANDDYAKLYGKNPVASVFDTLFGITDKTRENLQEFSGLSLSRNTYATHVPILGAVVPKFSTLPPQYEQRYQDLLNQQDDKQMGRFVLRQIVGGAFDIFFDPFSLLKVKPKQVTGGLSVIEDSRGTDAAIRPEVVSPTPDGGAPNPTNLLDSITVDTTAVSSEREVLKPEVIKLDVEPLNWETVDVQPPEKALFPSGTGFKPSTKQERQQKKLRGIVSTSNLLVAEIPNTVDIVQSAPIIVPVRSIPVTADPIIKSTVEQPRSVIQIERLPDVWDEPVTTIQPVSSNVSQIVRERLTPMLPSARIQTDLGDVWNEPPVMSPLSSSIEPQQLGTQRALPGTIETPTEPITWTRVNKRDAVRVEESSDGSMMRRTFEKDKVYTNESSAVEVLSQTDLIPKVLENVDKSITYEKLDAFPIERVELFPELVEMLGQRVRQLHDAGVVHEDLHLGNALYDGETIKFIDFENATVTKELDDVSKQKAIEGEVGFIRDELEIKNPELIPAFDKGYGIVPKVETPKKPVKKVQPQIRRAVQNGAAQKINAGQVKVTNPEAPSAKKLEEVAVDLTSLNGEYDIREIPMLLSRANAAPGQMTFNGKVNEPNFAIRTVDQILRLGSLIPHPQDPSKPLIAPTLKLVQQFEEKYGVPHPYKNFAKKRTPTKGRIENVTDTIEGKKDRHKSIAHLAVEAGLNFGSFYQKILDPSGSAISDQLLEKLERGVVEGRGVVIKTARDTYSVLSQPPTTKNETTSFTTQRNEAVRAELVRTSQEQGVDLNQPLELDENSDTSYVDRYYDIVKQRRQNGENVSEILQHVSSIRNDSFLDFVDQQGNKLVQVNESLQQIWLDIGGSSAEVSIGARLVDAVQAVRERNHNRLLSILTEGGKLLSYYNNDYSKVKDLMGGLDFNEMRNRLLEIVVDSLDVTQVNPAKLRVNDLFRYTPPEQLPDIVKLFHEKIGAEWSGTQWRVNKNKTVQNNTVIDTTEDLQNKVEDNIIQEEKLQTALANIEEARREIETQQATVPKQPQGKNVSLQEAYNYLRSVIERDGVLSNDVSREVYSKTVDSYPIGMQDDSTSGLHLIWETYSSEPLFGQKKDVIWLNEITTRLAKAFNESDPTQSKPIETLKELELKTREALETNRQETETVVDNLLKESERIQSEIRTKKTTRKRKTKEDVSKSVTIENETYNKETDCL